MCLNNNIYVSANGNSLSKLNNGKSEVIYSDINFKGAGFRLLGENEFIVFYRNIPDAKLRCRYIIKGKIIFDIENSNYFYINGLYVSVHSNSTVTILEGFKINKAHQTWTFIIPDEDKFDSRLVLENNLLVFITENRWLYALEATSGNLVWKTKAGMDFYHYNSSNRTLIGMQGSYLEVFDFMTGRLIHSADLTTAFAPYDMHLLSHMGTVVGDAYYFVYNAQKNLIGHLDIQSGTLQHIQAMEGQGKPWILNHPPVVHNNHLYILTTTEVLYDFEIVK